jgi:membrane fusion protein, multidrug efflux system
MKRHLLPLLLAFALAACDGESGAPAREPAVVSALSLSMQPGYSVEHEYSGSVVAIQHEDVGFELNGTINRVLVDEGESIAQGQLLAELDTQLLQTDRQQFEAQIAETAARSRLTDANLVREQSLKRSGFVAEQRLDELRAEKEVLEATLQRLRANLDATAVRLEKSRLQAPFAGVVTRRYRDTGAVIGAGTPVLRLLDSQALQARVGVPAAVAAQLLPGTPVTVRIGAQLHQARVLTVGADIDPVTRTIVVRAALPAVDGLVDGELIALRVEQPVEEPGAWVPLAALSDGVRGLWVVQVLAPQDDGSWRVESRDVQVLHAGAERVFVSGALRDGERVIDSGVHRVAPGQTVRLADSPGA